MHPEYDNKIENEVFAYDVDIDEPTSAMDAIAEYEIFERMHQFAAGKTVVIAFQRYDVLSGSSA